MPIAQGASAPLADVFAWKTNEGNDVHLLREGPASKRLVDALEVPAGQTVTFVPNLQGGTSDHGLEIEVDTGIVRALAHPGPTFPKVRNFILTALSDPSGDKAEIRIQIHDAVKDLWLSPPALTVRQDAGCRFTVLARFTDESIGDVTEWTDIAFQSDDPSIVVQADGSLQSTAPTGGATITATLKLTSPPTDKTSFPASALARPGWAELAQTAKVEFVAGRIAPNLADSDSAAADSVKSVVEGATNILFVSEGFRVEQRFDYRNLVNTVVGVMRGKEEAFARAFEPYGLLRNSINYWTLFIPSEQSGISIHGEHVVGMFDGLMAATQKPLQRPADSSTDWTWVQFLHEVGLPLRADAGRSLPDLVSDWQKLFGNHVTQQRVQSVYNNWADALVHQPINDQDTAFGMHLDSRGISATESDLVNVLIDPRRAGRTAIDDFIPNLQVAGFPIGQRWKRDGPDKQLIAFICLSDRQGGFEWGITNFSASTTGLGFWRTDLHNAPDSGVAIDVGPVRNTYRHMLASVLAHELSHALGLGDEYGDGGGAQFVGDPATSPPNPNLQAKEAVAPAVTPPATVEYHSDKIKWLWPRITKGGVLTKIPEAGDIGGEGVKVHLRLRDAWDFVSGDIVRFRRFPTILEASRDAAASAGLFRVSKREGSTLTLAPVEPVTGSNDLTSVSMAAFSSTDFLANFLPDDDKLDLVVTRREAGKHVPLVAKVIRDHIETSKGPLNAPKDAPTAACVASGDSGSIVTPTNLPSLTVRPRTKADIVGIYEGGDQHDCGVFRPAGRCRMRDQNIIMTPFCFVCRYLIVDRVDPAVHGKLDRLYPEVRG